MVRKLIKIGNSVGVTLDKKLLQNLGLDGVTWVWVEPNKGKKEIVIRAKTERDW